MRSTRTVGPGTSGVYRSAALLLALFFSSPAWAQVDTGALGHLQGCLVTSNDFTGLKHTKPFVVARTPLNLLGRSVDSGVSR